jgi:hypothetical protein
MGAGTAAVSVVSSKTRPIAAGMLIGTAAGLIAGAVTAGVEGHRPSAGQHPKTRELARASQEDETTWRLPGTHLRVPMLSPYTELVPAPLGSDAAPALVMGVMGPI